MKRKQTLINNHLTTSGNASTRGPSRDISKYQLQGQDLATERRYIPQHGWRLFAKQHARAGSLVMEYVGEIINRGEAQQQTKSYFVEEISCTHLLHISPSTVIDATRTGNDARYMAHSLDPNCQCQRWVVDNQPRGFMVALRDIAPGEELTYSSHMQCSLGQNVRCLCGPAICHSGERTPVLQSQFDTERMADAVLKCIQAKEQTAAADRSGVSTPPRSRHQPACAVSPPAFCSPPQTTREDINALGLDSPDSFLDQLHSIKQRPSSSSLHTIAGRCQSLIGQLGSAAQQQHPQAVDSVDNARHADSGAVLASSRDASCHSSRLHPSHAHAHQAKHQHGMMSDRPDTKLPHRADRSGAAEARQQLDTYLATFKGVVVGKSAHKLSPQMQIPAEPYQRMRALKSVLAGRLQAQEALPINPESLLQEAGWQPHLQDHLCCCEELGRSGLNSMGHGHSDKATLPCAQQMVGTAQHQAPNSVCLESLHADQRVSPVMRSTSPNAGMLFVSPQQMHPVQMLVPVNDPGLMQTVVSAQQTAAVLANGCQPVVATPLQSPTASASAREQHVGEGPTVSPAEAVLGSLSPPNTPQSLQGCQVAHVNSTLKSLGLTAGDIQQILHNAAVYTNNNGSVLPVA